MIRFSIGLASALLVAGCPAAQAANLATLHQFRGTKDGSNPEGGLIIDKDGVLYGTTDQGGTNNSGTVFSMTPPAETGGKWTFKLIHRFDGSDGGYPLGLSMDGDGNLFGYTFNQFGSVFRLEKPMAAGKRWRFQTLHVFSGGADGAYPTGVAAQADGSVIGTTSAGGIGPCTFSSEDPPSGCGVVFRLAPAAAKRDPWQQTLLHQFPRGSDGAHPNGAPIAVGGSLYGVAVQGGSGGCIDFGTGVVAGCGVVYRLTPDGQGGWTEAVAFDFAGGADGAGPFQELASDANGALYGVTAFGGDTTSDPNGNGVAYQLVPADDTFALNVLHRFVNGEDGSHPESGLVLAPNGKLFGTAEFGPTGHFGSVFSLARNAGGDWTKKTLATFGSPKGVFPMGRIVRDGAGAIYGVTYRGGKSDRGTVYKVE